MCTSLSLWNLRYMATNKQTSIHMHFRNGQCCFASVGLAQACPNDFCLGKWLCLLNLTLVQDPLSKEPDELDDFESTLQTCSGWVPDNWECTSSTACCQERRFGESLVSYRQGAAKSSSERWVWRQCSSCSCTGREFRCTQVFRIREKL